MCFVSNKYRNIISILNQSAIAESPGISKPSVPRFSQKGAVSARAETPQINLTEHKEKNNGPTRIFIGNVIIRFSINKFSGGYE